MTKTEQANLIIAMHAERAAKDCRRAYTPVLFISAQNKFRQFGAVRP